MKLLTRTLLSTALLLVGGVVFAQSWVVSTTHNGSDKLAWFADNEFAHGTFNIGGDQVVTLGPEMNANPTSAFLTDQQPNGSIWDGKTLTKTGAGTLVLGTINDYSGGTIIKQGTVLVNAIDPKSHKVASLGTESVANNGTLCFDIQKDDYGTFNQLISGTGTVEKIGAGTLIFGNSDYTYWGATTVTAGELVLGNANIIGSAFTVSGKGTSLSGNGKIGSLVVKSGSGNAVISPGQANGTTLAEKLGTLSVFGTLKFEEGSLLDIQVAPNLDHDRVEADTFDLSRGALKITPATDSTNPETEKFNKDQYLSSTIVAGTISGQFASTDLTELEKMGYTAELYYARDSLSLALVKKSFTFSAELWTYNSSQLAKSLDRINVDPNDRLLYQDLSINLRRMDKAEAIALMNEVTPIVGANSMMLGQWDVARPTINRMNMNSCTKGDTPIYPIRNDLWIDTFTSRTQMRSDGNGNRYEILRTGFLVGYDHHIDKDVQLGAMFGFSRPDFSTSLDRASANDFQMGIYLGQRYSTGFEFKGYAGFGFQRIRTSRMIRSELLVSEPVRLNSDYDGHSCNFSAEFSRPVRWEGGSIFRSIAAVDYTGNAQFGHTESGDPRYAAVFKRSTFGRFLVRAGARLDFLDTEYTTGWLQLFYACQFFGRIGPEAKYHFVSTPDLLTEIKSTKLGSNYISFGLGNRWNLNKQKTSQIFLNYDLNAANRMTTNMGSIGFYQKY